MGYIRWYGPATLHAGLCPPENRRGGRRDHEEGKKRHQRKIGKVARMNEAVSIDADGNALGDFQWMRDRSGAVQLPASIRSRLTPPFTARIGGKGRAIIHFQVWPPACEL